MNIEMKKLRIATVGSVMLLGTLLVGCGADDGTQGEVWNEEVADIEQGAIAEATLDEETDFIDVDLEGVEATASAQLDDSVVEKAACTYGTMGGPTSCKPPAIWLDYARQACAAQGKHLAALRLYVQCSATSYRYARYQCC